MRSVSFPIRTSNPDSFASKSVEVFRQQYPHGTNYVVSPQAVRSYERTIKGLRIVYCGGEVRFDEAERS